MKRHFCVFKAPNRGDTNPSTWLRTGFANPSTLLRTGFANFVTFGGAKVH